MPSSYKLTVKVDVLNQAAKQAFRETALLFGRQCTQVITEPRNWAGWNGPRDIVDVGRLRSSQQVVFTDDLTAELSWPVEYAAPVHEGYTTRDGKQIEGRPWTEIAAQEMNAQQVFSDLYQRYS